MGLNTEALRPVACRGRNNNFNTAVGIIRECEKEKHSASTSISRVAITYSDGETSGNRVFRDKVRPKNSQHVRRNP
jgi:hypothetical protein